MTEKTHDLTRREFVKQAGLGVAALAVASTTPLGLSMASTIKNGMGYRTLGRTGLEISEVALGGGSLGPTGANLIRAADVHGITTIARMQNNFELALHALDGGAQGVLIARVKTADDAQAIVDAAKFQPEGKRTIFFRSRGGGYALDIPSPEQWTLDTNAQTMAGCIMEEGAAVENLAEILAVPGIDFIDLGPLDLSHSKGWIEQSELNQLVDKIVTESVKAGKAVNSPANVDNIPELLDRGFRMLTVSPTEFFQSGATQFLSHGREVLASKGIPTE